MQRESFRHRPLAVIGVGCRLPGASDERAYWDLIAGGRTAFGPIDASRFDRSLYFDPKKGVPGRSYTDLAGCVSYDGDADASDGLFSPGDARRFDPAHLALCRVAAGAVRNAGYDPKRFAPANTGVYVGHARPSGWNSAICMATYVAQTAPYLNEVGPFRRLPEDVQADCIRQIVGRVRRHYPHRDAHGEPRLLISDAARLIAKTLGLSGPYMVFNSACASSLHALLQAARALQRGTVDAAVVGGASYMHGDTLVMFSQAQSVTARGSCPFGDEADGLVVGEGYVAIVLKTLDAALAAGDSVRAVIRGIGVSSDGRGKSLWAPRRQGQIEAMRRAYPPDVAIDRLGYIEAHATSTRVGDATEIEALAEVIGDRTGGRKIPIGSVKANIGHTLEAAGLAGLLKTILVLENATIAPAILGYERSRQIDWNAAPLDAPCESRSWPPPADGRPRCAAVNAFGIGGLNLHVVLEEFNNPASRVPSGIDPPPSNAPRTDAPRTDALRTDGPPSAGVRPVPRVRSQPAPPRSAATSELGAVAVVGLGAVFPGARTYAALADLFDGGRDVRSNLAADRWDAAPFLDAHPGAPWCFTTTRGGYVTDFQYDWRRHKIPPKQLAQASPLQFMMLDAVDQAFHHAGYLPGDGPAKRFDRRRTGAVVGTIFGGDFSNQLIMGLRLPEFARVVAAVLQTHGVEADQASTIIDAYRDVLLCHMPALLDETGSFTSSSLASRITKSLDLMGGAVAVESGFGSSLAAVACCVDQLLAGDCDLMICVGGDHDLSPIQFEGWSRRGLMRGEALAAPLDEAACGVVPGEGCGALLLKRLADARRDDDTIHAVIRGVGGGFGDLPGEALRSAIARSLADSVDVAPGDVAALEWTGTADAEYDGGDLRSIARELGAGRSAPLRIGTVVGQIGHTGAASGMASLMKATQTVARQQVAATVGLRRPSATVEAFSDTLMPVVETSTIDPSDHNGRVIVGVASGGPGEAAFHLVLERGSEVSFSSQASGDQGARHETSPVVHFDATERRKARLRRQAQSRTAPPAPDPARAETRQPTDPAESPRPKHRLAPREAPAAMRPNPPSETPPAAHASPGIAPASAPLDEAALDKLLIHFVVEQTGYPEEIVDMEADLEADLGIDSIKKAQLFGELRELFDVADSDELSLDDFSTLGHIREFLLLQATPKSTTPVAAPSKSPQASPALASDVPADPSRQSAPGASELEAFLVNFVVEQTGYPEDIVELDADLEADLGIDSIKKAQLFGELREHFAVEAPDDGDALPADFPTLRHVMAFLQQHGAPAV